MSEVNEPSSARLRKWVSRRTFVNGIGVAVAAAGLVPIDLRLGVADAQAADPLSQTAFAAHRGQMFRVRDGASRSVEVVLDRVIDRGRLAARLKRPAPRTGRAAGECFSVVFRGSHRTPLTQGTYTFTHPRMGTFPLFIVPGATGADGMHYEAQFNRLPS